MKDELPAAFICSPPMYFGAVWSIPGGTVSSLGNNARNVVGESEGNRVDRRTDEAGICWQPRPSSLVRLVMLWLFLSIPVSPNATPPF